MPAPSKSDVQAALKSLKTETATKMVSWESAGGSLLRGKMTSGAFKIVRDDQNYELITLYVYSRAFSEFLWSVATGDFGGMFDEPLADLYALAEAMISGGTIPQIN